MKKEEQKTYLGDYLSGIIEKTFKAVESFPEDNEWGELQMMKLVLYIIEFDPPVNKIIKHLQLIDHKKNWFQDASNEYTHQKEIIKHE